MIPTSVLFAVLVVIVIGACFWNEFWIRVDMHLYRKAEERAEKRMLDLIASGKYDHDASKLLEDVKFEYIRAHIE